MASSGTGGMMFGVTRAFDHHEWGRELRSWWGYYNGLYLGRALQEPVLRITDSAGQLGAWDLRTRTLSIAEDHIRRDPWMAVMETLRHEMAHQFAHEVLGAADEPPHGPAFRAACDRLCADPRASGDRRHGTNASRPEDQDPILARIHKLLALGTSPNENEARVAVNKARELLLRHNIDNLESSGPRRFGARWLGDVRSRHHLYEQILGSILGEFFFVSGIWIHTRSDHGTRDGTILEVCGTPRNLEMAEYVHGYLNHLLPQLWRSYKVQRGVTGNRERLRYYAGVLEGFRSTLRAQDRRARAGTALVWTGDPELAAYFRTRHPRMRNGSVGTGRRGEAYDEGVATGRNVSLRKPVRGPNGGFGGYLAGG